MANTPNLNLPEIPQNSMQLSPAYNESMQTLDCVVQCGVQSVENVPPVTDADDVGVYWLVGPAPTGAFVGHANALALCTGAGLWKFFAAGTQVKYFLNLANGGFYKYDAVGSTWTLAGGLGDAPNDGNQYARQNATWAIVSGGGGGGIQSIQEGTGVDIDNTDPDNPIINVVFPSPPGPPAIVEESTTALAATPSNSGKYTRFTNIAAKTYTFNGAQAFVPGAEYHGRNVGAGDLTLVGSGGFSLGAPAGGTLVVPVGGTFTVKIVSSTAADVVGYTVAA